MSRFGVFFTCFKEKAATEFAIANLRAHNPDVPILLISDGGIDFSYLENSYDGLKTLLENDSRSCLYNVSLENFLETEMQEKIHNSASTFLDRISRAIDYTNREYILIMEPDNLVRGKLSIPEGAMITGTRVNKAGDSCHIGHPLGWRKVLAEIPGALDVDCWGATAPFLNCRAFCQVHDRIKSEPGLLKRFCESDPRFGSYDILLPVLFGIFGYPEVINPELVSANWHRDWRNTSYKLIDSFYENHPKKGSQDLGLSGRGS